VGVHHGIRSRHRNAVIRVLETHSHLAQVQKRIQFKLSCSCINQNNFCTFDSVGSSGSSGRCAAGWEYREDKCYKVIFPAGPATTAEKKPLCSNEGSQPAAITSQAENDWVTDFSLKAVQAAGKFPAISWLTLVANIQPDKSLKWENPGGVDCPVSFTNWAPGEPRGDGGTVLLHLDPAGPTKGKWDDIPDANKSENPILCVKAAIGAPANAAACDYKYKPTPQPTPQPQCCGCQCNCECRRQCC